MALVMTIMTVMAVLGGISLLLWLSTMMEARHVGPLSIDLGDGVGGTVPAMAVIEQQAA